MTEMSAAEAATVRRFEMAVPAPESWDADATCRRLPDTYIKPRYPVDEPPTYRAQCSCGWTGPERYRWITDSDWERHNRTDRGRC